MVDGPQKSLLPSPEDFWSATGTSLATDAPEPPMKRKKGFSLIETLVSLAVILVLLTGIAELLVLSLRVKRKAEEHIKIAELAASKLEQLKTLGFESDDLAEGTSFERIRTGQSEEYFCRETGIVDLGAGLKKIEVSIYPEPRPERRSRIVLIISRELGF